MYLLATKKRPVGQEVWNPCEEDSDDRITIALHGQGTNAEFARLTVGRGLRASALLDRVAGMLGQPPTEIVLMNLDSPMYLVGDMRLTRGTRVGVRVALRSG